MKIGMKMVDKTDNTNNTITLLSRAVKFIGYIKRYGKKYGTATFIIFFEYYDSVTKNYVSLPKIEHTNKDFNITRYSNLLGIRGSERSIYNIRKEDLFSLKDIKKYSELKDVLIESGKEKQEELFNQVVAGKIGMKEYREFGDNHITLNVKRFISELYEQDAE